MTSRDLFNLEHGDTGVAIITAPTALLDSLPDEPPVGLVSLVAKVKDQGASVAHSDRDKSEAPQTVIPGGNASVRDAKTILPQDRTKRLVSLSRWERAGMLAYIAATFPQVFDETYSALGLGS